MDKLRCDSCQGELARVCDQNFSVAQRNIAETAGAAASAFEATVESDGEVALHQREESERYLDGARLSRVMDVVLLQQAQRANGCELSAEQIEQKLITEG